MNYTFTDLIGDDYLEHYGIKGMKWGVRRYQNADGTLTSAGRKRYGKGEKMSTDDPTDSAITKRVKADYNNLSDREFMSKYKATKNTYRKRVNKYGDPYKNAPLAKFGKRVEAKQLEKARKTAAAFDKDIDSLRSLKKKDLTGEKWNVTGKGTLILTEKDISDSIRELSAVKLNTINKALAYNSSGKKEVNRMIKELENEYQVVWDSKTRKFKLTEK